MARPHVTIGQGVKVFRGPKYGREDGTVTAVDDESGIIDALLVKSGESVNGVKYKTDIGPEMKEAYWTELPLGYRPGSEGH